MYEIMEIMSILLLKRFRLTYFMIDCLMERSSGLQRRVNFSFFFNDLIFFFSFLKLCVSFRSNSSAVSFPFAYLGRYKIK